MNEIVKVEEVAQIAVGMEPESGHGPLLDALSRRYPSSEFRLVCMSSFDMEIGGLIGRDGMTVAEDFKAWVTGEFLSEGKDAKAVYRKYNEARMTITEEQGEHIVITAPYDDPPEAFLQLELHATRTIAERLLLDKWLEPECLDDLLYSSSCLANPQVLSPWRYKVTKFTDARSFLHDLTVQEHTRHRTESQSEVRFVSDWRESSAGLSGAILCAHWWLDFRDARSLGGRLSFIPRWVDADCSYPYVSLGSRWSNPSPCSITSPPDFSLPCVEASAYRSIYTLMAALEEFDELAGYPMAWYFYMLHGNRVAEGVGDAVVKAVREGKIGLPDHDARVLMRWRMNSYGF